MMARTNFGGHFAIRIPLECRAGSSTWFIRCPLPTKRHAKLETLELASSRMVTRAVSNPRDPGSPKVAGSQADPWSCAGLDGFPVARKHKGFFLVLASIVWQRRCARMEQGRRPPCYALRGSTGANRRRDDAAWDAGE